MANIIKCEYCGKQVYKKRIKKDTHYCSRDCANNAKGSLVVVCSNCSKDFRRGKNSIKGLKNIFCSRECYSEYKRKENEVYCSFCKKKIFRIKSARDSNKTGKFFCGFECRSGYSKQNNTVKCVVCGKDFYKHGAEIKRHPLNCCSITCRSEYNNKRILLICPICKKKFYKPPSLIKNKNNVFCSVECHDTFQTTKELVKCAKCGKRFYKHLCLIKRSRLSFCSQQCVSKYRFKGSFVETEFEELIKVLDISYIRNDRTILKPLELDFWFPDIQFAVEINGRTHYKPVYGQNTLDKVRNRDRRKHKMCKALGIKLRTVKPGNCRRETYLPRYKKVVWEIKKRMNNFNIG